MELLEIELFEHLIVYQQNVFTNHIINIYAKQDLA